MGYCVAISAKIASRISSRSPFCEGTRSFHINSSRYSGSFFEWHPRMVLSRTFVLFQYDSTFWVWTPDGDTNSIEWLTVSWLCTWGSRPTSLYDLQSLEWTILPGAKCWLIIGRRVAAERSGTNCIYPIAGEWEVSTIPKTHFGVVDARPLWYYREENSESINLHTWLWSNTTYLGFMIVQRFIHLYNDPLTSKYYSLGT